MSKARPATWACNECGEHGTGPDRAAARAAFEAHWGDVHNVVPWLEDGTE